MKTITATIGVLGLAIALSGCLALAAAGVAAGVVHATGDDSSEVHFENSFDQVYDACIAQMQEQGKLNVRDKGAGRIVGHVEEVKVEVQLSRPTENTVKVVVTARKLEGLSPSPDTAEAFATGLVRRLK